MKMAELHAVKDLILQLEGTTMNTSTLIRQVEGLEAMPPTSPIGITLEAGAMQVLDGTNRSIEQIFAYAEQRLDKVTEAVALARETVEVKRKAVQEAMKSYVEALQMVEHSTTAMQKLIGDVLLSSDRLST